MNMTDREKEVERLVEEVLPFKPVQAAESNYDRGMRHQHNHDIQALTKAILSGRLWMPRSEEKIAEGMLLYFQDSVNPEHIEGCAKALHAWLEGKE